MYSCHIIFADDPILTIIIGLSDRGTQSVWMGLLVSIMRSPGLYVLQLLSSHWQVLLCSVAQVCSSLVLADHASPQSRLKVAKRFLLHGVSPCLTPRMLPWRVIASTPIIEIHAWYTKWIMCDKHGLIRHIGGRIRGKSYGMLLHLCARHLYNSHTLALSEHSKTSNVASCETPSIIICRL